jgi:hypothetical protein
VTGNKIDIAWPMLGQHERLLLRAAALQAPRLPGRRPPDQEETARAVTGLRAGGFAERELRVYTGPQILTDHQLYAARQGLAHRAATNDQETLNPYFGPAGDGRLALWVYVVDDAAAGRAIRYLADCATLHIRHYGHRQSDFYLARPTS